MAHMARNIPDIAQEGEELEQISVHLTYDIIRLFSEGLYRSPHKAVEELVTNGYDAGAERVHILLPPASSNGHVPIAPLWVIDDGHGMDADGFHQLWRVADSNKTNAMPLNGRAPIGQFGIGKLASYVLAWKLTHLSRVNGQLLFTSMDFRKVTARQTSHETPETVSLREIDEESAMLILAEIKERDPSAWDIMFHPQNRSCTWTAAGLSDFKDLYKKLSAGRLRWVLSTGLPLHANFRIQVDRERISSSKESLKEIKYFALGSEQDTAATSLRLRTTPQGPLGFPGIGEVAGTARIYERRLTTGKSGEIGRSNGFFIRVRGRVINLDDELFGLEALNHAAWSRFVLEVTADGLREHLLSSREGVRDSDEIQLFRNYLRAAFNICRSAYDAWLKRDNEEIDIAHLLSESPSAYVTDPLFSSVRNALESGLQNFYITAPRGIPRQNRKAWLNTYSNDISETPFAMTQLQKQGPNAPALVYDPNTRMISVNADHPFVDKLTAGGKNENPARLFASSEVLIEGQLQDQGISTSIINEFMRDRDKVLRLMAGDAPPTASEVVRRIKVASRDHNALERAVGAVFQVLGFQYERKGGSTSGADGVLYARLGRHKEELANYSLVYDAKQTNQPAVPANRIHTESLEDFRKEERANFGFFIANQYHAEADPDGRLNRRIRLKSGARLTLLKIEHLSRLIWLHYEYGVTLTELRTLFESARTVPEVTSWIDLLDKRLSSQDAVPLRDLLNGLEEEKKDPKATPSIIAVRAKTPSLQAFEPERLIARLKAVENIVGDRWIEVSELSGEVIMHQTAEQILSDFQRNIDGLHDEANDGMSNVTQ